MSFLGLPTDLVNHILMFLTADELLDFSQENPGIVHDNSPIWDMKDEYMTRSKKNKTAKQRFYMHLENDSLEMAIANDLPDKISHILLSDVEMKKAAKYGSIGVLEKFMIFTPSSDFLSEAINNWNTTSNLETVEFILNSGHPCCHDDVYKAVYTNMPLKTIQKIFFLSKEFSIDSLGIHDEPLLMAAIRIDRYDLADFFLSQGANINTQNSKGDSVLSYCDDVKSMKYLIDKGIDINIKDNCGRPNIYLNGLSNEVFLYLIEQGADLTVIDNENNNIYHYCPVLIAENNLFSRLSGVDINLRGTNGKTPLLNMFGYDITKEHLEAFIQNGADATVCDENNETALTLYILYEKIEAGDIIKFLIDSGCPLNVQNRDCETAFMLAVELCENDDVLSVFLERYTEHNYSLKNREGKTLYDLACDNKCTKVIDFLKDHGLGESSNSEMDEGDILGVDDSITEGDILGDASIVID